MQSNSQDVLVKCNFCEDGKELVKGDRLYEMAQGPRGYLFEAVRLNFCPVCGIELQELNERREAERDEGELGSLSALI